MDNTTNIVVKRSTDSGRSWDRHRTAVVGGVNPEAVFDRLSGRIIVAYCGGGLLHRYQDADASCAHAPGSKNRLAVSQDGGLSWGPGALLKGALEEDDGVFPGPGQAIQLRSNATGRKGRLVFSGHKPDRVYNRLGVVWVQDPGRGWRRTAALPRDTGSVITPASPCRPLQRGPEPDYDDWSTPVPGCRGPGETTLAELRNGSIMLSARNQFCDGTGSGPTGTGWRNSGCFRYKSLSHDGGEVRAPGLASTFVSTQSTHSCWARAGRP